MVSEKEKEKQEAREEKERIEEEKKLAVPVDKHERNSIVLKTVQENLTKVAASFQAQQAKEGADPEMVALLELAQQQLEAIKL